MAARSWTPLLRFLLFAFLSTAGAFISSTAIQCCRRDAASMLFGSAKPKKGGSIDITVKQKFYKDTVIQLGQPANLRKALLEKGIDLYPLQGKIYNCGGGGSCGTCAVKVLSGMESLSPKSPVEKKLLGKKPDSFRLSCCTRVNGSVEIETKP